ncbi:LuxR C-terminal-related transcriptional regulator [Geodermatophilus marinus]|uniref:LuxR C-terminal-related transcriptional regulator n=1 Tax=Geodermatophilus sp. LHW52908 TaxID=2303986 RepID=UPI001F47232D|nr:LuxR C-terminal-related transcriptional regulator [Geodermatophilus sp. LHW52908]
MGPLLTTKLHPPRRRRGLVARARLDARLDRAGEVAVTLVSAPAGFGKTTILTEWLAAGAPEGRSAAWLSLDARDNDPALFWSYLVAALQTAVPDLGATTLAVLQSPQTSTEAAVATLVNELADLPRELVLVLDDYHVVDSPQVHEGMVRLVEHLPVQVHLVIAGRADPPLPLARLRARGELLELRAAELRFTAAEVAAYLTGAMGLTLTADDVAALDSRTEGWIAAVQLAALSMQGREDPSAFVAEFAGDDRYIVDFLVEEVLARQPERVRTFLLQTSILARLSGPLCDAVTGGDGGKDTLEAAERANLFLVPLDDRRRWYRYHHLFADVLQAHLRDEQPDAVAELHRRAADWHARHGDRAEAIGHALAGGDAARAAELVELALPALQQGRQEATMRRWLQALPDEVIAERPVLSVGYAAALMVSGETAGVEARLRDAERWLIDDGSRPRPAGRMVVVDEAAFRRLPSGIALYRAGQALLSGDVPATVTHARRALELAGADDHVARGGPAGLLGLAYWRTGDLDTGARWYAECAASLEQAGHLSDVTGCALALADMRLEQGRLAEAMSTYENALRLVTPPGGPVLRGAADMHVGIAGVLLEHNELDAARRRLAVSAQLGEHAGLPQNPHRERVARARLAEADGDLDGALALLAEAERRYAADYFPEVRPIGAVRARLHARAGRWPDALAWGRQRGLSADDDPDYLHEFEHLVLARALVARYAADGDQPSMAGALRLLARLRRAAEDGGRTGSLLDVLVVLALAAAVCGDQPAALAALRHALELAEPRGHVRSFLDEGRLLRRHLAAVANGRAHGYAGRLLAASSPGATPVAARPVPAWPVEPLSARELEVLRLLGTDLDGPGIARRLFVSVNTVRTHTKNLYAKLGVNNRRTAVRRGQELDLLTRGGDEPTLAADSR